MIASISFDLEKRLETLRTAAAKYRAATSQLMDQLPAFLRVTGAELDAVLRDEIAKKFDVDLKRE